MFNPEAEEVMAAIKALDIAIGQSDDAARKQDPHEVADWIWERVDNSSISPRGSYRRDYEDLLRAHAERRMGVKLPAGREPPVR